MAPPFLAGSCRLRVGADQLGEGNLQLPFGRQGVQQIEQPGLRHGQPLGLGATVRRYALTGRAPHFRAGRVHAVGSNTSSTVSDRLGLIAAARASAWGWARGWGLSVASSRAPPSVTTAACSVTWCGWCSEYTRAAADTPSGAAGRPAAMRRLSPATALDRACRRQDHCRTHPLAGWSPQSRASCFVPGRMPKPVTGAGWPNSPHTHLELVHDAVAVPALAVDMHRDAHVPPICHRGSPPVCRPCAPLLPLVSSSCLSHSAS